MKKPHVSDGASDKENVSLITQQSKDNIFLEPVCSYLKDFTFSYYENVKNKKSKEINLLTFCDIIKNGALSNFVSQIRNAKSKPERDTLKTNLLPAVTTSGVFKDGHSLNNFTKHSGLIQIDFDSVSDLETHLKLLQSDKYTFISFISPSGNGIKLIVRILPEKHQETFALLKKYYKEKYNLILDEKCKDISRLMFLSCDENIFININSKIFDMNLEKEVETIISRIEQQRINIVPDYDRWLKVGFALADGFNEDGRDYFHRVSKIGADYDREKCNKQFSACLAKRNGGTTIKSFFKIAQDFGIDINIPKVTKQLKLETNEKAITNRFLIVGKYIKDKYDLRFNTLSNSLEISLKSKKEYCSLNEHDLYYELQSNDVFFSQANLLALLRSNFVDKYDPIKEYFENLPEWDGVTDQIGKLCGYVTVKDLQRFEIHFRKMFVRCIACSLGGVFNKQAFIFIGGQNSGKSTFTRWLCPNKLKDYLTENISTDKDSLIALAENFFIILDELATLHKSEINTLKSFFTKDKVKVRRPFDKKPEISARRANFIGSTNTDEFLTDETGSVRWVCFNLTKLDFNYSKEIDLDLVWAQAYFLFKAGFKYELTTEELLENSKINLDFQRISAEMEFIQKHFEPATKENHQYFFSASEILHLLSTQYGQSIRNVNSVMVGKALKTLGFEKCSSRDGSLKMATKGYYVNIINPLTTLTTITQKTSIY